MTNRASAICLAIVLAGLLSPMSKAEILGYNCSAVPANSDAYVSVPFAQQCVGTYTVTAVDSSSVTVVASLGSNAYQNTHYVRFTSGAAAGVWATVTSNSATQLFIADPAAAGVQVGDTLKLCPHQTLISVFPAGMDGVSFKASTSPFVRSTEVLVPSTGVGTNKSAGSTYFFYNGAWRKVGSLATISFNSTIIPPQSPFIIRNNSGDELKFYALGDIDLSAMASAIPTYAQANDVALATGSPVGRTLKQLALGGTPAFQTSTSPFVRKDELLVYDNASPGKNKSAAATYFFYSGAWRKVGALATVSFDDEVLPAGSVLVLRKVGGAAGVVNWTVPSPF